MVSNALLADLPANLIGKVRTARELTRDRDPILDDGHIVTGIAGFDTVLDGGLRRGSMVELIGGRSTGRFSLVMATLATLTGRGEPAALIDLGDGLDPAHARDCGIDLERLLWVRPRTVREAVACTEPILGTGISLVVIDLGLAPLPGGRGNEAAWLRLARAARDQHVALLVSSPYRVAGTATEQVVRAQARRPRWHGGGETPCLLDGLANQLESLKRRGHAGHARAHTHWVSPTAIPTTDDAQVIPFPLAS
ncbi:MAG: hypothetical protein AAGD38_24800 [Acidobacteriota bacterium]